MPDRAARPEPMKKGPELPLAVVGPPKASMICAN